MVSVMFRSIWSILSCLSSSCRDAVSVCSWQYSDVFSICVQSLKYCLVSGIMCFGVGYSNTSSASRRMVIRVLVSASCRRFKISKCNEWWVQQGCRCWIEFHHGYPFQWQCVVRWIKWPWSMWFARSLAARGPLQIAVQAAWGVRPHQTIPNILLSHVTFLFPCMVSHVSQLPGTWNTWSLWSWVWYLLGRSRRRRGGTAGGWSWVTVKHFCATRWKGVFKEFLITISSHQSWKKVKHQTHPNPSSVRCKEMSKRYKPRTLALPPSCFLMLSGRCSGWFCRCEPHRGARRVVTWCKADVGRLEYTDTGWHWWLDSKGSNIADHLFAREFQLLKTIGICSQVEEAKDTSASRICLIKNCDREQL